MHILATENIVLSYKYGAWLLAMEKNSVPGMDAHAHARNVDRVPPHVGLERHGRGGRWMGQG